MDSPRRFRLLCFYALVILILDDDIIPQQPMLPRAPRGSNPVETWLLLPYQLFLSTGLRKEVFLDLSKWIQDNTPIVDEHILVQERLTIFLYICRYGVSYRACHLLFQRPISTISRSFLLILRALTLLHYRTVL